MIAGGCSSGPAVQPASSSLQPTVAVVTVAATSTQCSERGLCRRGDSAGGTTPCAGRDATVIVAPMGPARAHLRVVATSSRLSLAHPSFNGLQCLWLLKSVAEPPGAMARSMAGDYGDLSNSTSAALTATPKASRIDDCSQRRASRSSQALWVSTITDGMVGWRRTKIRLAGS